MRIQDQLRALLDDKPGPFSPHWINHARRLMTQAAHALDAADEALTAQPADARPPLPYTPDHVDPHAVREAVAALAQQAEPVAERARQLWNTIKILGLSNDNLALFAIRTALTSQLAPPTVALKSVHLTRDVQGMCEVLVNGRVVIRDNGDIINHFATPDWFAAPPAPAAVPQQAQPQPVAWKHDCAGICTNDVELWIDACPHCGKPRTAPPAHAAASEQAEQIRVLRELVAGYLIHGYSIERDAAARAALEATK